MVDWLDLADALPTAVLRHRWGIIFVCGFLPKTAAFGHSSRQSLLYISLSARKRLIMFNKLPLSLAIIAMYGFMLVATPSAAASTAPNYYIDASVKDFTVRDIVPSSEVFHLLAHGEPGALWIAGERLAVDALADWLVEQGVPSYAHLNVYGCSFGAGEVGAQAVRLLSERLGVTVAASDDVTGRDGDWELEVGAPRDVLSVAYPHNLQACNERVRVINDGVNFTNATASVTNNVSSLLPLCLGSVSNVGNVVDANASNFSSIAFTAAVLGCDAEIAVRPGRSYPAGTFAGFEVSANGLLSVSVLAQVTVRTYLGGNLRESRVVVSSALGVSTSLLNSAGNAELGFVTSQSFDEIRIEYETLVGLLYTGQVYNAIVQEFCAGPSLSCNVQTSLTNNDYPVVVNRNRTGIGGICVGCAVNNTRSVVDSDPNNFATLEVAVGVAGTAALSVEDVLTTYSAGTFAGFEIENPSLLSVQVLSSLRVTTYLNGVQRETLNGSSLISASTTLLNGTGRQVVGFVTSQSFDEVQIQAGSLVGLLNVTRVYRLVLQRYCAGPALACNVQTPMVTPAYPVLINNANTGIGGLACVGCSINGSNNIIDADTSNFATINLAVGVLASGQVSVKDQLTDYPAGSFAGFDIENNNFLDLGLLDALTITTYLNGVQQESVSGQSQLLSVNTSLLTGDGRRVVGFLTTQPFDEVQITAANLLGVDLGVTRIYNAIFQRFCAATIACDQEYVLTAPDFPVLIEGRRTGVEGAACIACSVNSSGNVVNADTTDFATLTVAAGVLGSVSLSVVDAVSTYPAGTVVGFAIEDLNTLLQVELLNSLAITTYLNGVQQERFTGNNLLELNLLFGLINLGANPGIYKPAAQVSLPFDEVRITLSSVLTAISSIRVYAAFIDTKNSNGFGLACQGDTDGDGVVDINDPAPNDPCVPVQTPGYVGYDANNAIWAAADCDGDGVTNGQEATNGSDPYDPCDPTICLGDNFCNRILPFVNAENFKNLTASVTDGVGSLIPPCLGGVTGVSNLIDLDTDNFATVSITGLGCNAEISVLDTDTDFSAGTYAGSFVGFRVSANGILQASVSANVTISTYLNGVLQESRVVVSSLLGVNSSLVNADGTVNLGFITTQSFDEFRIEYKALVGVLYTAQVYHAILQKACAAPALNCNVQTRLTTPTHPMVINTSNTGLSGLACVGCSVTAAGNVLTDDPNDFATIALAVGVGVTGSIAVENALSDYAAGTFAGFDIENPNLLGVNLLSGLTVRTYRNGAVQEAFTGNSLASITTTLLNGTGRQIVGFVTTLPYDQIELEVANTLGLLNTTRVYSAIVQRFCAGPPLACNALTRLVSPTYPAYINNERSQVTGAACIGCSINNTNNVVNANTTDFAEIDLTVGVLSAGSIAVKDPITDYPAGTFAGFDVANVDLLDIGLLDALTITTYLNGVQQQSVSGQNQIATIGTALLANDGRRIVGFVTNAPFDEVQLTAANLVGVNLGLTRVYSAVVQRFCAASIVCDSTYFLSDPDFPVAIDGALSGVEGIACVGCAVNGSSNVIDGDTNTFATITVTAGVAGTASLAVVDALSTYPVGTRAGFVIQDLNTLAQVELFSALTICTYLDGVQQECRTAGDLLDLNLLFSLISISVNPGTFNVGFQATQPFDEVRLSVGSVASVISTIRVFGAFVNTDNSNGGGLTCLSGEICDNGFDDDGDGLVDCGDSDCIPTINNVSVNPTLCPSNSNNGSIVIDAVGSSALEYSITNEPNYQASNTFTNLGSGLYTVRVRTTAGCTATFTSAVVRIDAPTCVEVCDNGIDDDGDGLIDCDDPDCNVNGSEQINKD